MSLSVLFSLKRVTGGFLVSSINRTSPFHLLCQFPKVAIINSMRTLDGSCLYKYVLCIHVCTCKKKDLLFSNTLITVLSSIQWLQSSRSPEL